jgi:NADH-quinone oxidoreductase subunit C
MSDQPKHEEKSINGKQAEELEVKKEPTDSEAHASGTTQSAGGATPEQQALAAELQKADPAKQTTSEPSDAPAAELKGPTDGEKEAKAKAAAEARAARANARAKKADGEENAAPKEPSPKQPLLDRAVQILRDHVGEDAVMEAFINEKDGHLPYIIIHPSKWAECAEVLRHHEEFKLDYLRNVAGVDMETHLEVVYHFLSMETKNEFCVKVRTDREAPSVPSVTPVWATANWNEREIYDLFGIDFPGHPDLRRIMMPDDWVGHPLRKDYEAIDPEV